MSSKFGLPSMILLTLMLAACGSKYKESIQPIYAAQAIQLKDEHVQYWSTINPTTVDPSGIHQLADTIFGWIPLVGGLVELPIDLTTSLLPPLPSTSYPALPKDAAWNDPRVMSIVSGLRLGSGSIRITPRELRGPDWKPDTCWLVLECPDVGIDEFLKEVRVYLLFKDEKNTSSSTGSLPTQVLLASADTGADYDKGTQTLSFHVSQENIRPYLDRYANFEIKIIATGNYPNHTVYLDGKLRLDLDLKLSKE